MEGKYIKLELYEQLQATNKELLEALEKIASRTQDTSLLWWQKLAREAITNAKQREK